MMAIFGKSAARDTKPEAKLPARRHLPVSAPSSEDMKAFWPKLRRTLAKVPFAEELAAAWYCWSDPETPTHVKAILASAIAYFVLPTDMLPDVIAGIGFTDDATVLATAFGLVGAHVKKRHKNAARKFIRQAQKA